MKKILTVLLICVMFGTLAPTLADAKATKTYYKTTIKSATGKKYTISLRSNNAKKEIADFTWGGFKIGDVLYKGTFSFYVNNKKTTLKTKKEFNRTQKNIRVIPSKKGTPQFLSVKESLSLNYHAYTLYYMYNGQFKKVKSEFGSTVQPIYAGKNLIKVAQYNNRNKVGYDIYTYRINPKTGKRTLVKKQFQSGSVLYNFKPAKK
ncbi:hypothetical protein [Kurthia gibsonii]|uniref:hypothetical protein n=1 Tax=Kurthia gibsonii TaxID=33946 RepID=UPI002DB71155|nr:hypothetical protein [Kurthia gibsonii]MEB7772409.1 hypothetical protein [Kurthia gibsonii]